MPEGLSPAEVGKGIAEHRKHTAAADTEHDRHDRWLSIVEALLLSLVAVLAAYSGYAAAKWGTESSVTLAKASAERTKANRADTEAIVTRTLDSASFNAWFIAFTAGNANDQAAGREADASRLSPGLQRLAGDGPRTQSKRSSRAGVHAAIRRSPGRRRQGARCAGRRRVRQGSKAGQTADKYIRATVFLATVLFLVGISGHFRIHQARMGLIAAGGLLLGFAVIQLLGLPGPPA